MHRFETRFRLDAPPPAVFDLLCDPRNLDSLTPPWLRFSVITPMPVTLEVGTVIDYRLRWRRLPLRWRSEIVAVERPWHLTYEQRRGPYRAFRHAHTFRPAPDGGGTEVLDGVDWAVWGDRLIARRVAADLEALFRFRTGRLGGELVG